MPHSTDQSRAPFDFNHRQIVARAQRKIDRIHAAVHELRDCGAADVPTSFPLVSGRLRELQDLIRRHKDCQEAACTFWGITNYGQTLDKDGESYTNWMVVNPSFIGSKADIDSYRDRFFADRADYPHPGYDCCGQWFPRHVEVTRSRSRVLIKQRWYQDI